MAELVDSINKKNIIAVSRNQPVALVIGSAGFLGSHLVEKLLSKNIQVIGVDNLSTGRKENLDQATKFKNFHLLIENAQNLALDIGRLDYVFVVAGEDWDLSNLLSLIREKKAKCLLVSTIDLYDEENEEQFKWFKKAETHLAKYAAEHQLNARVLRLGAVFGPKMLFRVKDPIVKLIEAALNKQLQKVSVLEFSTRALYVEDACDLAIKAMLSGATAQKIFDGVLPTPIKVAEIEQILLDPVWYEVRRFTPSELPPWPTPNLFKTIKILNWHPKTNIVAQLRETLSYFVDHEIPVPKVDAAERVEKKPEDIKWPAEKKQEDVSQIKRGRGFKFPAKAVMTLGLSLLIAYAIVFPVLVTGWGVLTFKYQLSSALNNLSKGDFKASLGNLAAAKQGVNMTKSIFDSIEPVRKVSILNPFFELGDNLYGLSLLSLDSAQATVLGIRSLYLGVLAVTGESNESPKDYFSQAQGQLSQASEEVIKAKLILEDQTFTNSLPKILGFYTQSLKDKLSVYADLVDKGRASAILLPEIVALDGAKSYLILLQNNMELRPTGGFIGSFAQISFAAGKLKKIEVADIYSIDGQLSIHVEPPKEIKEDLGQKDWFLRDSNWEPDFPTSAKQAEWFFTKETGQKVLGVVALDVTAMEKLLGAVGPLDLADYNETITADNLFERAIAHAETSFFAGSQAKKNFLTALTSALFNKIFFLPNPNWPGIVKALGDSVEEKHMSMFLDDPKLFSYLIAQNWAGVLPRESNLENFEDFIAAVEANLGANKSNYYLDRSYSLETVIGKEGEIRHRLKIVYVNKSPSDSWPAGKYKNRFRIYLPFGTKLTRILWGETNLTKDVSAFVDFGRTAFSTLLELSPKETKTLILDYEVPGKVQFKAGKGSYKLNVVKQAGTLQDPFVWKLTYPLNYQLASQKQQALTPQELMIQTDLSQDRSFEVEFRR